MIVNRWHKGDDEPLKSIEKETKRTVFACLPNDFRKASAAMNLGTPLMENHNNVLTDQYRQLADQLAGYQRAGPRPNAAALSNFFHIHGEKIIAMPPTPLPGTDRLQRGENGDSPALIQKLNLDRLNEIRREDVRREVAQILEALVVGESTPMNLQERERLAQEVLDEVFGLGPLEPLLNDPTVSDILVNTYKQCMSSGTALLESTSDSVSRRCSLDEHHRSHCFRYWTPRGRIFADGRRPAGGWFARERDYSSACGRRSLPVDPAFRPGSADGGRSVSNNTLTPAMLELLQGCVKARLNILISGGTGAGKTTFLNVLSSLHFQPRTNRHD